jgi:hypothetical protein
MRNARSAVRGALIVSLLACATAWLPGTAAAEQQLQVSPTKTMLQAEAGATVTANITITAPKSGIDVSYQHADFGFNDKYEVVLIPDIAEETTSFSTRRWFTAKPSSFALKGSSTRTIPVRIKVPKNTPSGTYMGAAIFMISPSDKAAGGQIQANVSVASLIFVSVAGGDPPKAKIRRFDVPRLVTRGTFTPDLILDNVGTLGFTADGSLHVDKLEPTARQTYAPQYVQPHKPRTLHVQGSKKRIAQVDTRKLGIGKHTVTLRLRIDPTNATLVVHKTFWVIPMWIRIVAGLLLLTLILGGSWLGVHLRQRYLARRAALLDAPTVAPLDEPASTDAEAEAEADADAEAEADAVVYDEYEEELAYDDEDESSEYQDDVFEGPSDEGDEDSANPR